MKINLSVQICTLILFISSCANKQETIAEESFPVTNPIIKDTTLISEYIAEIQSSRNVEIRTRINGYLDNIHVDEGKYVTEGQLLFSINKKGYEEELQKAKAMVKSAIADAKEAEIQYQNTKKLFEKNIVSAAELEMLQLKLDAKNAIVEEAKAHESSVALNLSYTSIHAPFSGKIDRIPYKSGSLLNAGELLTSISDNNEVVAYFNVSEEEYLELAQNKNDSTLNKSVELILVNDKLFPYKGKIETSESEFDKNTGNIAFRVRFPNPEKLLKHGSSGKIKMAKKIPNALIIPQKSTLEVQDKIYIYTVNDSNIVKSKIIQVLYQLPHLYIIKGNLNTNEKILLEGVQSVKEGSKIKPIYQSPEKVFTNLSTL